MLSSRSQSSKRHQHSQLYTVQAHDFSQQSKLTREKERTERYRALYEQTKHLLVKERAKNAALDVAVGAKQSNKQLREEVE